MSLEYEPSSESLHIQRRAVPLLMRWWGWMMQDANVREGETPFAHEIEPEKEGGCSAADPVVGYLAHKKLPPPRTLQ